MWAIEWESEERLHFADVQAEDEADEITRALIAGGHAATYWEIPIGRQPATVGRMTWAQIDYRDLGQPSGDQ